MKTIDYKLKRKGYIRNYNYRFTFRDYILSFILFLITPIGVFVAATSIIRYKDIMEDKKTTEYRRV